MALEGTIADMSLVDIFQVLSVGRKTGILILHKENIGGLIYVVTGELRDALIIGERGRSIVARGEAAVVQMLRWSQGSFIFRHNVAVEQRPLAITRSWQWLVRVAAQQGGEKDRGLHPDTPRLPLPPPRPAAIAPDAPLVLRRAPVGNQIKLDVDDWRLLSWIAQSYSARRIAHATGAELAQILARIEHLHEVGLVKVAASAAQNGAASYPYTRTTSALAHSSAQAIVLPERRVLEVAMRRLRGEEMQRLKLKIVITGAYAAGKTHFLQSASDIDPMQTEYAVSDPHERAVKETTTVALDFGTIAINDDVMLYMYGTPGQERFSFMWDTLSEGAIGYIVLVDSCRPSHFAETIKLMAYFQQLTDAPFVVAANKQDDPAALPLPYIRARLALPPDVALVPCVATERASTKAVLLTLLDCIMERVEAREHLPACGETRLHDAAG